MGLMWEDIHNDPNLLVFLYILFYFFVNFGPNTTTFVIPTEIFPIQVRATCHGISAASGKIGATLGVATFTLIDNAWGKEGIFISCAVIALLGFIVTYFYVFDGPSNPRKLEREFVKFTQGDNQRGYVKKSIAEEY